MTFAEWWDEQLAGPLHPFNMRVMCQQAWNAGVLAGATAQRERDATTCDTLMRACVEDNELEALTAARNLILAAPLTTPTTERT